MAGNTAASPEKTKVELTCPLCGRRIHGWRKRILLSTRLCRRCWLGYLNRRQMAFVIDYLLWNAAASALFFALVAISQLPSVIAKSEAFFLPFMLIARILLVLKDTFGGYSPGKAITGLRVVDQFTLEPIGVGQCIKRNALLLIPYVGVIANLLTHHRGLAVGDRIGKTRVVWTKYAHKPPFDPRGIFCLNCGYNLTGNVSGICPECGIPIPKETAANLVRMGTIAEESAAVET